MLSSPELLDALPLPLELQEHIFSFLDEVADVAYLAQVNSHFCHCTPRLWRQLIKAYFPYLCTLHPQAYQDQPQQLFQTEYLRRKKQDWLHFNVTPELWHRILKGDLSGIPQAERPEKAYSLAASMGNQCAFEFVPRYSIGFDRILESAIINGDKAAIFAIKTYWSNEAYNAFSGSALIRALEQGYIDVVKYVMSSFLLEPKSLEKIFKVSAKLNLLEIMQLVLEIEKQGKYLPYLAQTSSSVNLAATLKPKCILLQAKTAAMQVAAQQGYLEIVKFCFENFGFEITEINQSRIVERAFARGHFEIVAFLFPYYQKAIGASLYWSAISQEKFATVFPELYQAVPLEYKQPCPLIFNLSRYLASKEIIADKFEEGATAATFERDIIAESPEWGASSCVFP